MESALYFIHYSLLLLFGILLSAAFSGVFPARKNAIALGGLFAACGLAQLAALWAFGEEFVWMAYPLLGHAPVVALLCLRYRKRLITALAAVATAYLCCQPAKWFGVATFALSGNEVVELGVRIVVLLAVGFVTLRYAAGGIASIYAKDTRSVLVFGSVPFVYYLFDYATAVYSDHWQDHTGVVVEFFPFFMALAFLAFCMVYHQTYEQKAEAERREQIASITAKQQARELEVVRRAEHRVRMLRHDMRHLLNSVSLCLEEGDVEAARRMLAGYAAEIEDSAVHRWCGNDVVNYIVSDYQRRCEGADVRFECLMEMGDLPVDETAFASILSNALENALNAQETLELEGAERSRGERWIKLTLKVTNGRLLLSVTNPCAQAPEFVDGMPVSKRVEHGYGTQSIRYMAERLGGSCQFSAEGGRFLLRVVVEL